MSEILDNFVVLITSADSKISRFGTGFAIDQDDKFTYLLTCAHVIKDIGGEDLATVRGEKADVIALGSEDALDDLAVLRISLNPEIQPIKLGKLAETGRKFLSIGYQLFEKDRYIVRSIAGIIGKPIGLQSRWKTLRIKAWELNMTDDSELQPGFSGSPVIDETSREVVGVMSYRQGTNKGIAIDVETLNLLPPWQMSHSRESIKSGQIAIAVPDKSYASELADRPKSFTMFYGNKKQIGLLELEKIYQASILLADNIYIEANVSPDPRLDLETKDLVLRKLLDLKELGVLKVWGGEDYTIQIPRDSLGLQIAQNETIILDYPTYKKIYDNLTHKSLSDVSMFYRLAPKPQADPLQGVTEIVEGRRNLWNIAVASHFGADRILTDDSRTASLQTHLSHYLRYSVLEEPVLEKFLDTLNIGPLARLGPKEVEECRQYTKLFRNEFLKKTGKAALELADEAEVTTAVAKALVNEYTEQLEYNTKHSDPWRQFHKSTATTLLNLLGYFSPHSIRGDLNDLLLEWGVLSNKAFPLLLIVKLRDLDKNRNK